MLIEPRVVDEAEVRRINHLCTGVDTGLRDGGLLSTACARPVASAGGEWVHPGVSGQALAILDGIVNFHPFIDGNKRTAVVAADLYLYDRGFVWRWDETSKLGFMVTLASGRWQQPDDAGLPGTVERIGLGLVFFDEQDRDIVLKAMIMKNHELLMRLDEYDRLGGDRDDARGADGDGG